LTGNPLIFPKGHQRVSRTGTGVDEVLGSPVLVPPTGVTEDGTGRTVRPGRVSQEALEGLLVGDGVEEVLDGLEAVEVLQLAPGEEGRGGVDRLQSAAPSR
jgi:hypothetical protein